MVEALLAELKSRQAAGIQRVPDVVISQAMSKTECRIANIWKEVLDVEDIKPGDAIFDLGADSLQIFRILSREWLRRGWNWKTGNCLPIQPWQSLPDWLMAARAGLQHRCRLSSRFRLIGGEAQHEGIPAHQAGHRVFR